LEHKSSERYKFGTAKLVDFKITFGNGINMPQKETSNITTIKYL